MKKKLILLDAHAMLHRGYHALPNFTTYHGEPTGALYGFIKMILKMKDELKPDYVVACFDRKEKTFRHEVYQAYKGTRGPSDDELISQIVAAPSICEAMNIPVYSKAGFEADDLLGTIIEEIKKQTFKVEGEEIEIFIVSGDMDTLQLIDKANHVKVYTMKKGLSQTIVYDYQGVVKKYGFTPEQIPDFKGLAGDSSDNITGVKGIGEKTATKILQLFGTLENMYDMIHKDLDKFKKICEKNKADKITPRIINLLIEGEEEAIFSKTLATIRRDAPIDFQLPKESWLAGFDNEKFLAICNKYEFHSFRQAFTKASKTKNPIREESGELAIGGYVPEEVESIEPQELAELKILLNLNNSEITNPDLETILNESGAKTATEAKEKLLKLLQEKDLLALYEKIEKPVMAIVREMETNGIGLDTEVLTEQKKSLTKKLKTLEKKIYAEAGEEFNISSPKQLSKILYDKLKIGKNIKKTPGGERSTNAKQLEKLKEESTIVQNILDYRELFKALSTYVEALPRYVASDGKIHSTFIQTGTATGRISSENPNLQNIPVKEIDGVSIRSAFVASPGCEFVSIDYSQIDLRSAAILSGDPSLIEIFEKGTDIHSGVAALVYGVKESEVTKEMRAKAKVINFGIMYGMGVNALKEAMKVDRAEAQEFYDKYKETFKVLISYLEDIKKSALKNGYTETLFKRRRQIPLLKSKLPYLKAQGERIAINAPVQGTTADILKLALIDTDNYLKQNKLEKQVKIVLQVYDELIFEVDKKIVSEIKEKLQKVVREVLQVRLGKKDWVTMMLKDTSVKKVPLKVEVGTGKNMSQVK